MIEVFLVGVFTLAGVYFGAKIAKGKEIFADLPRKMRAAVRTEEQEADLMAQIEKKVSKGVILNG